MLFFFFLLFTYRDSYFIWSSSFTNLLADSLPANPTETYFPSLLSYGPEKLTTWPIAFALRSRLFWFLTVSSFPSGILKTTFVLRYRLWASCSQISEICRSRILILFILQKRFFVNSFPTIYIFILSYFRNHCQISPILNVIQAATIPIKSAISPIIKTSFTFLIFTFAL